MSRKKNAPTTSSEPNEDVALLRDMLQAYPDGLRETDFACYGFLPGFADQLTKLESTLRGLNAVILVKRALETQADVALNCADREAISGSDTVEDLGIASVALIRTARNALADYAEIHGRFCGVRNEPIGT